MVSKLNGVVHHREMGRGGLQASWLIRVKPMDPTPKYCGLRT